MDSLRNFTGTFQTCSGKSRKICGKYFVLMKQKSKMCNPTYYSTRAFICLYKTNICSQIFYTLSDYNFGKIQTTLTSPPHAKKLLLPQAYFTITFLMHDNVNGAGLYSPHHYQALLFVRNSSISTAISETSIWLSPL